MIIDAIVQFLATVFEYLITALSLIPVPAGLYARVSGFWTYLADHGGGIVGFFLPTAVGEIFSALAIVLPVVLLVRLVRQAVYFLRGAGS